jgi:hypothetical protein
LCCACAVARRVCGGGGGGGGGGGRAAPPPPDRCHGAATLDKLHSYNIDLTFMALGVSERAV